MAKTITIPDNIKVDFTWAHEKGATVRAAEVTFDLTELDEADVIAYMVDSLTIKHQGSLRRQFGTDKWVAPATKTVKRGEVETLVEVYSVKASKPGERKNADPTKKLAKEIAAEITASGLSLDQIKALVEQAKQAELAKSYESRTGDEPPSSEHTEENV